MAFRLFEWVARSTDILRPLPLRHPQMSTTHRMYELHQKPHSFNVVGFLCIHTSSEMALNTHPKCLLCGVYINIPLSLLPCSPLLPPSLPLLSLSLTVLSQGHSHSPCYRFMSRWGDWLWVRSKSYVTYNPISHMPDGLLIYTWIVRCALFRVCIYH